jgi:hypothetical protein
MYITLYDDFDYIMISEYKKRSRLLHRDPTPKTNKPYLTKTYLNSF